MAAIHRPLCLAMFICPALLLGCATGTTFVEMTRTAGFVGVSPGTLYVAKIEGKDSTEFRDKLYEALSADRCFSTERYGITPPENLDSITKMPTLILSGSYSTDRDIKHLSEGSGADEKNYRVKTEIHEFRYLIQDAFTGEEVYASVARYDQVDSQEEEGRSFLGSILDAVIGDPIEGALDNAVGNLIGLESGHREAVARNFAASLRLHQERRSVELFWDKDIPELKEGVEFLRNGNWIAAIAKFQAGAENHPDSKSLHKAYFNLGVAFEYNHEFDRALASLRLAEEQAPQEQYSAEIDFCEWFARHYRWQARYGGPFY